MLSQAISCFHISFIPSIAHFEKPIMRHKPGRKRRMTPPCKTGRTVSGSMDTGRMDSFPGEEVGFLPRNLS